MNGPPPPKGVVGTKVKVQVTSLHHDKKCCTVWGARYKTTFAPGVVTACAKVAHVPGKCNFADNFTKEQKCNATFTASRDSYMCSLADGGCWKVSTPISNVE